MKLTEPRPERSERQAVAPLSPTVRRNALRGEQRSIDVLDPEGRYLGTLPEGSPFPIAFLSPDTLITEETDELDVEYLVAYSVGSGDAR